MSNRKAVISLYDYTGIAVMPFADAGYTCFCFDIQHETVQTTDHGKGKIIKMGYNIASFSFLTKIGEITDMFDVVFMSSFPPCTDLAVSGAAHFAKKLEANPDYRKEAMNLVYMADLIGRELECPYYIESPISVISTEWCKPDYMFHPYEFGGYIPDDQAEHPQYPDYIMPKDAYPKRTCLWVGGGYELPEKKPVEVLPGYSKQHRKLGGRSLKTKNIRSATPRGFSIANFEKYGV